MRLLPAAALAMIAFASGASAQIRTMTEHAQTAAALKCLLDHAKDNCPVEFGGAARRASQFWLFWTPNKDVEFGPLKSSDYAGTQEVNAYLTQHLSGRTADVYSVGFGHGEWTFYIARPRPDGKIQYMFFRPGRPDDEKMDQFVTTPH